MSYLQIRYLFYEFLLYLHVFHPCHTTTRLPTLKCRDHASFICVPIPLLSVPHPKHFKMNCTWQGLRIIVVAVVVIVHSPETAQSYTCMALAGLLSWLACHPSSQDCRFNSQSGHRQESTNERINK